VGGERRKRKGKRGGEEYVVSGILPSSYRLRPERRSLPLPDVCGRETAHVSLAVVFSIRSLRSRSAARDLSPLDIRHGRRVVRGPGPSRVMRKNKGCSTSMPTHRDGAAPAGAEMSVPDAEPTWPHLVAWAIQAELTVAQRLRWPF